MAIVNPAHPGRLLPTAAAVDALRVSCPWCAQVAPDPCLSVTPTGGRFVHWARLMRAREEMQLDLFRGFHGPDPEEGE